MKLHIECPSCGGTGVYVGFTEKNGASVVCSTCRGTGGVDREYVPFTQRKVRTGIRTVVLRNHGIVLAPGMDLGEVTYEEFVAGKMPTDDSELYERITGKKEMT